MIFLIHTKPETSPVDSIMEYHSGQASNNLRGLPDDRDGVLADQGIRSEQGQTMYQCLTNQHAVKRVSVDIGQLWQHHNCFFFKRQWFDGMQRSHTGNELTGRTRQWQPPQSVLDEDFPNGHATGKDRGGFISKYFARAFGEFRGVGDKPEEGTGVQKNIQGPFPLNVSRRSSGRGSKKLSGTSNRPLAKPIGRGDPAIGGKGRISAIGTFLRQSNIFSPLARRSRYFDRLVFAS